MNDTDFDAARTALREARRAGRCLAPVTPGWVPADLAEAMRLQRAVASDLGTVRGWKISGLTADQHDAMGVDAPLAAPLLEPWVRESGAATFSLSQFVRPRLECEFAFELSADLPARPAGYTRDEVEAAIGALRIGVEIVDSRLTPGSPVLMELADDLNNGAYIVGPASDTWQRLRYAEQAITLRWHDGAANRDVAHGDGRPILDGDPVGAVVLLANLAALHPHGLRSGDIVTTGSCTGARGARHRRLHGRLWHARQRPPALRQLIRANPAAKRRAFAT
jgi:2-keto-4-pentenoate hydratase